MNNNISFTGFNNLYIGKKLDERFGSIVRSDGQIVQGQKNYATVLIKGILTDDADGADLTEFKTALDKCQDNYTARIIKQKTTDSIRFVTTRCMAKDEETGEKIYHTFEEFYEYKQSQKWDDINQLLWSTIIILAFTFILSFLYI